MLANTRSTRRLHGQQIEGKDLLVQSRSRKSFCDLELDYIVSFSPGWNFAPTTGLKRLLWLHAQFQPGRKTQISVRKFTEVRKHSQCACSRSFSGTGWNSVSITWDFFRFSGPFGRAENPSPVWEYWARIFSMLANARSTSRLHGQQIEGEGLLMQSPSRKSLCDLDTP